MEINKKPRIVAKTVRLPETAWAKIDQIRAETGHTYSELIAQVIENLEEIKVNEPA